MKRRGFLGRGGPCGPPPHAPPAAWGVVAAAICASLWAGSAAAGELVQTVTLSASFGERVPERVEAVVQQVGEQRVVALVDDGSDPADARGDRVWTGSVTGAPAQYLPIILTVTADGASRAAWSGVVRAGLEPAVDVAFEVTPGDDGGFVGRRRASASPGRLAHATEVVPIAAAAFWAVVALVYGAVVAQLAARAPAGPTGAEGLGGSASERERGSGPPG